MDEALGLADLHDIVLPEAPLLLPGEGFWVLLLLAVVVAVSAWRRHWLTRRRNAYRRAGLSLLKQAQSVEPISVHQVSVILKRVALAAWPREQVASLHGRDWVRFLNGHCRGCRFEEDSWERPEAAADPALLRSAARWIRGHRPDPVSKGAGDE